MEKVRYSTMTNISYYCLNDDENSLKLELFKYIHSVDFQKIHFEYDKKELTTNLFIKNESVIPFSQNKLVNEEIKKHGDDILPIVLVNGSIVKRGDFLSTDEMSDILGIGLSIQTD
ncbi:arsenic metallochaperone ArsD family protein [Listeria booriae]|uniref:arsenic metallochaperone ArsD family protein n=1 Tax=Listeria booriae TaxID=1552123 RepID=UPI0016243B57|nr:arsenic metallochaperone ArsD family protein [Listeria booriae]MBC2259692.1 arsenic metallochaperone ArsD family protein [Listeria booriae]